MIVQTTVFYKIQKVSLYNTNPKYLPAFVRMETNNKGNVFQYYEYIGFMNNDSEKVYTKDLNWMNNLNNKFVAEFGCNTEEEAKFKIKQHKIFYPAISNIEEVYSETLRVN